MFRLQTAWHNFCGFFISATSTGFVIFIVLADTTPFIHVLQKAFVDHIMMSFYEIPHEAISKNEGIISIQPTLSSLTHLFTLICNRNDVSLGTLYILSTAW
jgi:hypothetical protein